MRIFDSAVLESNDMQKIAFMTSEEIEDLFNKCLSRYFSVPDPEPKSKSEAEGERYLHSIKELSEFLGCSIVTAQKLKNSGRLRYRQFGRKVIFIASEILDDIRKENRKNNK